MKCNPVCLHFLSINKDTKIILLGVKHARSTTNPSYQHR
jgi:hypothetical protein